MLQLSEVGYKNKAERSISLYVDPFVMFVCLFMQSNILMWFNCNNRHLVLACWIRKEVKVTKVIIVFWTFVGHTDKLPVFWNTHFWGQHFSNIRNVWRPSNKENMWDSTLRLNCMFWCLFCLNIGLPLKGKINAYWIFLCC